MLIELTSREIIFVCLFKVAVKQSPTIIMKNYCIFVSMQVLRNTTRVRIKLEDTTPCPSSVNKA